MTEDITVVDRMYRIAGELVIKSIVKTKITPNFLTMLSFLFALGAAISFSYGVYNITMLGLILFEISVVLDYADGSLARLKKQFSIFGDWLDRTTDSLKESFVFLGIGYGLFLPSQDYSMLLLAFGCVAILLFRDFMIHTAAFCYKELQTELRKSHEQNLSYKLIRYIDSAFLLFFIVAAILSLFEHYLKIYLVFYLAYTLLRLLYSSKIYLNLGK